MTVLAGLVAAVGQAAQATVMVPGVVRPLLLLDAPPTMQPGSLLVGLQIQS